MSAVTMEQVLLAGFQADTEADKYTELLRSNLGLSAKNRVARLAMGRSLSETAHPSASLSGAGKPIKGDVLFGVEELPLWVGLLFTHLRRVNPRADLTLATLQDLVKRHWSRGITLLMADWEEAEEDYNRFIDILVRRRADMPESGSVSATTTTSDNAWSTVGSPPAPIIVDLGRAVDSKEPFRWTVNGVGYSPHVAVMGQAGSGKTRTMLELVKQVRKQSGAPIILLDLGKGDLANRHDFIEAIGARVLRVPEEPIPLDMFFGSDESELTASDAIMGFRDSFSKVMQSKAGAVQLETMKDALRPLFSQRKNISLDDIAQSLRDFYDDRKLKTDSVISTISDLTERTIFRPEMSPAQFFSQSWIITFAHAHDTQKNLAAYLLLDALNTYLKWVPEAPQDSEGHRAVRTVLAVDEARHLLASRHKALSDNIRLHRSKGLMVALASQSPDDYDGAGDDHLENIGLPICFKTNAASNQVLQNMFRGKVSFASLQTGVFMTLKDSKPAKIKAF
ncbi:MAG: helicase HerA domain-containing protein [Burkholderiaceae bacterium]